MNQEPRGGFLSANGLGDQALRLAAQSTACVPNLVGSSLADARERS